MKHLLKIGGDIVLGVVVVVLLLVTISSAAITISGSGQLIFGVFGIGRVMTGSMEPDIPTGSMILVTAVEPDELALSDVIMFRSDDPSVPDGVPVSHAIVDIQTKNGEYVFTTQGVANPVADTYPVHEEDIIGRVTWHSTVFGELISFTQKSWFFPIMITVMAIDLVFQAVYVFLQARELDKHENKE